MLTDNQNNKIQCRGFWSGCRDLNPTAPIASTGTARNLLHSFGSSGSESQVAASPAPVAPHRASWEASNAR